MRNSDAVRIIGAGPAGLSAAINLAKNGYKVIVYEKNADTGARFNNDFQGLENWTTEEDVLDFLKTVLARTDFFYKPFYKGLVYSPSKGAEIESKSPMFYLIKRGKDPDTLDNSLKRQALDLGVNIIFNTYRSDEEGDIIATGTKRPNMFAFGIVFETDLKDIAVAILNDAIAPKGYAYLLVSDKRATLATVIFGQFDKRIQYLKKAVDKFRDLLNFSVDNPKRFVGVGNFFMPRSAIKKGKIYIGEAAGFQDALFGFGIRYAIVSGYLAAKSIIEGINYDTLWKNKFGQQLRVSKTNRRLYELFGSIAYDFLVEKTSLSPDPRKLWREFYNTSIPRRLI